MRDGHVEEYTRHAIEALAAATVVARGNRVASADVDTALDVLAEVVAGAEP